MDSPPLPTEPASPSVASAPAPPKPVLNPMDSYWRGMKERGPHPSLISSDGSQTAPLHPKILLRDLQFNSRSRAHLIHDVPIRGPPPAPIGSICQACARSVPPHPLDPTPPPLLPQPHQKKRIRSKIPTSPHRNKGLTSCPAGGHQPEVLLRRTGGLGFYLQLDSSECLQTF